MAVYQLNLVCQIDYYLVLNPMHGRIEDRRSFGPFESPEEALAFHDKDRVPEYKEEGSCHFSGMAKTFTKSFAKGSDLEHMNPLKDEERAHAGLFGHGVHEKITVLQELSRTLQVG